jgi:hypothetical protein
VVQDDAGGIVLRHGGLNGQTAEKTGQKEDKTTHHVPP